MCSGNQGSFSDSLDCSPLCDGPHPEGKPSIRNPVINRGGEFSPGIQRERGSTGGARAVGRAGPGAGGRAAPRLLTGRDETLTQRFSFSGAGTVSGQRRHRRCLNKTRGRLMMIRWEERKDLITAKGWRA